jgi:hypothetical protein
MKNMLLMFALTLATAAPLAAQNCDAGARCNEFANAETTLQRAGIAVAGGNPVPGASSTLGLRLGAIPRISVAAGLTAARLVITDESTSDPDDELSGLARSWNVDATLGIFGGFSLVPTIGGFGSIDLLASYAKLSLPDGDGYPDDASSWSAGVRVGILRESFTAPGIGVSAMYRKLGDFQHIVGQPEVDNGSTMTLENNRAINLRATVGKRILMLGATAGIGYDKFYSDATLVSAETLPPTPTLRDELETSATTIFANLSWTMLILHIVGEGGVQRADGESAPYGSLAIRLAL